MKIEIFNRTVKFVVMSRDRDITLLPTICIYANRDCYKWREWGVHIEWILWAIGFIVLKDEDDELKRILKKRCKCKEDSL